MDLVNEYFSTLNLTKDEIYLSIDGFDINLVQDVLFNNKNHTYQGTFTPLITKSNKFFGIFL